MSWSESRLLDVIALLRAHRGDNTAVELKLAAGGLPKSCPESICAFANMPDGGTLILGIDEAQDFAIQGVSDPAAYEAGLVSQARNSIIPVPHIETSTLTLEERHVVIAEVSALSVRDRPARYHGKAYLRQADGDYVMHDHELRMLEVEKLHMTQLIHYDKEPIPGQSVDDLVPGLVESYLANYRKSDSRLRDRSDQEILRRTGVTLGDGQLTLAGLYAMGDYPQGEFPALGVTAAAHVRGAGHERRTRDLQDFTGPIPFLLENLLKWAESNLAEIRSYSPDGHIHPRPELPLSAVRELFANALVHRDLGPNTLGLGKSVQVRLTPDGLFVMSPGGLRGVSIHQLESTDHAQAAVNQRLYNIAKRLRTEDRAAIIEGEGGGIHEVFRAAKAYGLPKPTLSDTGVQFKATLWRPTHHESVKPAVSGKTSSRPRPGNDSLVLSVLEDGLPRTMNSLQEQTGLTSGQVRYSLNRLLEKGAVIRHGGQGHKGTTYQLPPQSSPSSSFEKA